MKTQLVTATVFLWCVVSYGWSVDSVTVDSVWNSDSAWYDINGVLQQRQARDCFISFVPQGSGSVSCSLAVSLDSGKSWGVPPYPLRILDNVQNAAFQCGNKGRIKARMFGGDRPNAVFKIIATTCVSPPNENPAAPAGATLVFSEGFGGDLLKWNDNYMIMVGDNYPQMRITTDAAHTGTHSITSDSNRMALLYTVSPRLESGVIAGVQFYIMAKALGEANFTVEIGQNAGSSGGLGKAFGIGFDPNDSIKCKAYDMQGSLKGGQLVADTMSGPIQLNHWYKCAVEVDLMAKTVTYYIDDAKKYSLPLPTMDFYGIDRLLVFRGVTVDRPNYGVDTCKEGPQKYYVDDIVLYKK